MTNTSFYSVYRITQQSIPFINLPISREAKPVKRRGGDSLEIKKKNRNRIRASELRKNLTHLNFQQKLLEETESIKKPKNHS
jgi:hypothetical protein